MIKFRTLIGAAVIAAPAFTAGVWAQQLTSNTITGLETWQAGTGGPGGPSIFLTTGQVQNSQGVGTTAAVSGTINIPNTQADLITTAAVTGAMTVNAPANPWNGEIFELINGSGSANTATVTFTAASGQTVNGGAVATQANQSSAEWRYVLATNTWYRLR